MAQDTYCHSKREEREHSEENAGPNKNGNQLSKLCISSCLMSRPSSDLQLLSSLLTAAHFSLVLVHPQLAALLGKYPMTLASLTSRGLQDNSGFAFTSS